MTKVSINQADELTSPASVPLQTPSGRAQRDAVRRRAGFVLPFIRNYGIVVAFVILVIVVGSSSSSFLTKSNLFNVASQWAPAGIMAVGMTFVILTGGFDLSIASGYALCAVTAAAIGQHHSPFLAFAAAIGVGLAIGLVNGLLIAGVGVNPFITTVGTGFILNGLALVITGNVAYTVTNPSFGKLGGGRFGGFPYSGMLLIAFIVIGGLVLWRSVYGHAIYAVGGNREASRLSGIRVGRTTASVYVLSGACMGVAGIISASLLSSAQANIDPNIVFDVITIVVIGGTSLSGGVGSMWRTVVGLGILATIANGFNLLDLNAYYQNVIKGVIIVAALALDVTTRRFGASRGPKKLPAAPLPSAPAPTVASNA